MFTLSELPGPDSTHRRDIACKNTKLSPMVTEPEHYQLKAKRKPGCKALNLPTTLGLGMNLRSHIWQQISGRGSVCRSPTVAELILDQERTCRGRSNNTPLHIYFTAAEASSTKLVAMHASRSCQTDRALGGSGLVIRCSQHATHGPKVISPGVQAPDTATAA